MPFSKKEEDPKSSKSISGTKQEQEEEEFSITVRPTTIRGHIKRFVRGSSYVILRIFIFQVEGVVSVEDLYSWYIPYERVEDFTAPPIARAKVDKILRGKEERENKIGKDRGRRLRSFIKKDRDTQPTVPESSSSSSSQMIPASTSTSTPTSSSQASRGRRWSAMYPQSGVAHARRDSLIPLSRIKYLTQRRNTGSHAGEGDIPTVPDQVEPHNIKEKRMPFPHRAKDTGKMMNHITDDKNRRFRSTGGNMKRKTRKDNRASHRNATVDVRREALSICDPALPFHLPFIVIDARRVDEYIESHVHGAINIPYLLSDDSQVVLDALPKTISKSTPIVTYCAVGLRSGLLQIRLRHLGFVDVRTLAGGYYKWVNQGRPIYVGGEMTRAVMPQHLLAAALLEDKYNVKKALADKNKDTGDQVKYGLGQKATKVFNRVTRRKGREEGKRDKEHAKAKVANGQEEEAGDAAEGEGEGEGDEEETNEEVPDDGTDAPGMTDRDLDRLEKEAISEMKDAPEKGTHVASLKVTHKAATPAS
eukprot:TRINITY_DN4057_c0_g2_i3.p1 TRINITY_DN4057_c0_g2~~TRINITY_DN4057_c0_g2_i3.p1  ORF type:complete len:533 (+),score=170.28 TRINITY_DN4057_c0_g2_i3:94-1692(+)